MNKPLSTCCHANVTIVVDPGENNDDPIRELYCTKCHKICDIYEDGKHEAFSPYGTCVCGTEKDARGCPNGH